MFVFATAVALAQGATSPTSKASFPLSQTEQWPQHEAHHSSPPNACIKTVWGFTSIPL